MTTNYGERPGIAVQGERWSARECLPTAEQARHGAGPHWEVVTADGRRVARIMDWRPDDAALNALAHEACEIAMDVYGFAGIHLDMDAADGGQAGSKADAGRVAEAWRELAAMVGRDRGTVQPGSRFAAMSALARAFYYVADAFAEWGEGRACVSIHGAHYHLGEATEYMALAISGKAV